MLHNSSGNGGIFVKCVYIWFLFVLQCALVIGPDQLLACVDVFLVLLILCSFTDSVLSPGNFYWTSFGPLVIYLAKYKLNDSEAFHVLLALLVTSDAIYHCILLSLWKSDVSPSVLGLNRFQSNLLNRILMIWEPAQLFSGQRTFVQVLLSGTIYSIIYW